MLNKLKEFVVSCQYNQQVYRNQKSLLETVQIALGVLQEEHFPKNELAAANEKISRVVALLDWVLLNIRNKNKLSSKRRKK